jgi:hypothetical protein
MQMHATNISHMTEIKHLSTKLEYHTHQVKYAVVWYLGGGDDTFVTRLEHRITDGTTHSQLTVNTTIDNKSWKATKHTSTAHDMKEFLVSTDALSCPSLLRTTTARNAPVFIGSLGLLISRQRTRNGAATE